MNDDCMPRYDYPLRSLEDFDTMNFLYPHNIHPSTLEHIVRQSSRRRLVLSHDPRLQRDLRVRPCGFPLGQLSRIDHHDAVDDLDTDCQPAPRKCVVSITYLNRGRQHARQDQNIRLDLHPFAQLQVPNVQTRPSCFDHAVTR